MNINHTPQLSDNNKSLHQEAIMNFMHYYDGLPAFEQVELFISLKEEILRHRHGMINNCQSDAEAIKSRHEELMKGLEQIKTL